MISFGWTTEALLLGEKDTTRRDWHMNHLAHFHAGDLVDAWNSLPRNVVKNPHKVATIRLTAEPYLESTLLAPPEDYRREGFACLQELGIRVDGLMPDVLWADWHNPRLARDLYVVRFEVVEYLEGPLA
jgi:hypothetical protein